jgi:3D (Asp-Asp-Asp) domain-containing protein
MPVRHKFRRLAGVPDTCKRITAVKPVQKWLSTDRTKCRFFEAGTCYGPAPVGAPGVKTAALAALGALLVLAAVSGATAAGPGGLKAQLGSLESQRRSAALGLYALESRANAAQRRLGALQAQADALRLVQQRLQLQIAVTRQTLSTSRDRLALNLRRLYKQGDVSALAVVLGSQSLDAAVSKLDTLNAVADESKQVVSVTASAQHRLATERGTLAAEQARLTSAVAAAKQTLDDLTAARAERVAFIARLRSAERLKTAQIAALEDRVQRAEHKSAALQAAAVADPAGTPATATPTAAPAPIAAPASGGRTITVSSTGYSLPGHTATGLPVGWGVVAVDPSVIPLGTRLTIPGYGEGVAADTGGAVRGNDIDLWFPTLAQARAWGRRTVTITLH